MVLNVTTGNTYYIRVINNQGRAVGYAWAALCMYEATVRGEDNFFTAKVYNLDGSNCGEQFNILGFLVWWWITFRCYYFLCYSLMPQVMPGLVLRQGLLLMKI